MRSPPKPRRRQPRATLAAAIALLASVGLLALLAMDAGRETERAREARVAEANRYARRVAGGLEAALAEAVFAEPAVGMACRIEDNEVELPAELGWVEEPPVPYSPWDLLDALTAERLRQAEAAGAAALRGFADETAGSAPGLAAWARCGAAWAAWRDGDRVGARADLKAARAALDEDLSTLSLRCSLALLEERIDAGTAAWPELLRQLPLAEARRLLALRRTRGFEADGLEAVVTAAEHRRRSLRAAQRMLREARGRPRSRAFLLRADTTVWFPRGARDEVSCEARILSLPEVLELAAAQTEAEVVSAAMATAGSAPPDVEPALGGLLYVRVPDWGAEAAAESRARSLLLLALVVATIGGGLIAWRSMRREVELARTESEFLTSVTHELKTPLTGIRLVAELLVDGRVPGREAHWLRQLDGEAARLGMLVENVLDLRRLERGAALHEQDVLDLAEVVQGAVEVFRPLADRDGMSVELRLDANLPRVRIDRLAAQQALANLLDNARKYARDGGRIDVVAVVDGSMVQVRVRDHGKVGIPAAERELVFERFRRGSAQRSGQIPGVGLGLHLARQLARRDGGDLRLCDVGQGPGTCFELTWPVAMPGEAVP